jgi:TatD DNase family protein
MVPDDRILVESDSPYLAPTPHRGARNEPAWVSFTVAKLAQVRAVEAATLGGQSVENARRLFAIK